MRAAYIVVGTALLAVVLHLVLGWGWTLGAGVVGGYWSGRRAGLVGLAGAGLSWLGLVGYSYAVAPRPTAEMARVMGGLLGNMPGPAYVGITLLVGAMLGLLGGLVGGQVRRLTARRVAGP